jgi:hypothetical protein
MYIHYTEDNKFQEVAAMDGKPVLVIMAAGMGSRYGGLKQIDSIHACYFMLPGCHQGA